MSQQAEALDAVSAAEAAEGLASFPKRLDALASCLGKGGAVLWAGSRSIL
jgi:hypothetical protein